MRRTLLLVGLSAVLLAILSVLMIWLHRSGTPSRPLDAPSAVGLSWLPADQPVFYRWTETVGQEITSHTGGVLFFRQGQRIYSRAWWTAGASRWPAVEGSGVVANERLEIAYRSASPEPERHFYHAKVTYVPMENGRQFAVTFRQLVKPDDPELSEGSATCRLADDKEDDVVEHRAALMRMLHAKPAPRKIDTKDSRCPVMPARSGDPRWTLQHKDKTLQFCCPSCIEVYKQSPKAFLFQSGKATPLAEP